MLREGLIMRCVNGKINSSYGIMPHCDFICAFSHDCEVKLDIPDKTAAFKKRFVYGKRENHHDAI
jgi:hypothetical protein